MFKDARDGTDLTQAEAAFRVHIGLRTLTKYEAGETLPPPDVVLALSKEYGKPEMVSEYCRRYCAIGQALGYEVLDNIDKSLPAVILKLMCEMKDCTPALDKLTVMAMSKISRPDFKQNDLTADEWEQFEDSVQAFLDVEHGIAILRESLSRRMDVSKFVANHNRKCVLEGYVKKEKDRLQAAI